jgi:hypothetical protein
MRAFKSVTMCEMCLDAFSVLFCPMRTGIGHSGWILLEIQPKPRVDVGLALHAFRAFDVDGDRKITASELAMVLRNAGVPIYTADAERMVS